MQDWLTLGRRPALVFGAGGLGGASAVSLAAQGALVALADRNTENLDAVVQAAKAAGGEVKPLVADLRTAEACRAAVSEAVGLVGTPQVFRTPSAATCASRSSTWRTTTGRRPSA
jgi:NAD(P)-dependent dehydrogenase (short-subunit alcohol dehydrogenase family)